MGDIKKAVEEIIGDENPWSKPIVSYKIVFDSQQAQLEPIYYWILDFIQGTGWKTEKIVDNFTSSPGSGHFSEMGTKSSLMQEKGMNMLGALNQVIKSVLNLIYDLKEFEIRLEHYDDYHSTNKGKHTEGTLALKQIWLDQVDIKRQRGAIHMMAQELGFTTIREAFMMADSLEDLKKMNDNKQGGLINDSVYKILVPRLGEFLKWIDYSESELRKRMKIEKSYLKSQIETIKLYSSWMKPYLKAAEQLRQKGFEGSAALVNAFSTTMFQLTLFGIKNSEVPDKFTGYNLKRKYHSIILIDLKFRGHVSRRVTQAGDQGFALGGLVEITFDCFALNEEELKLVKDKMAAEDVGDALRFEGDVAAEALDELKEDLEHFLKDDIKIKRMKDEKKKEDINPFGALFSLFKNFGVTKKSKEKKEIKELKDVKPDNFVEKSVRADAAKTAAEGLYLVYDIYKKSHGMASAPEEGFEKTVDENLIKEPETKLGDIFKRGK